MASTYVVCKYSTAQKLVCKLIPASSVCKSLEGFLVSLCVKDITRTTHEVESAKDNVIGVSV